MELASRLGLSASYKVLRVLEEGAVAQTLLALDRRTGVQVIVKVVRYDSLSAAARNRLDHHRGLVNDVGRPDRGGVIDTLRDGDRLCIVMPYVEGVTLRSRIENSPLTVRDSLTVARDLLGSLAAIHARGAVHRHVKPTNVMVDDDPTVRTATLVDFGVAATDFLTLDAMSDSAEDPHYMAPELAGTLDRPVDGRCDLYSTGIVLFECLAGRRPFEGRDIQEILRNQLSTSPPQLRTLGVPVPQALEEILRRLLRKDPDDRYHSARAALADVEELAAALDDGVAEPDVAVGAHDRRRTLTEPPLTGRENELALLHRRLNDASRGAGGTVLLDASSGGGKTRVLDEFCQRATTAGAQVLRAFGSEHSEQRPLHILAGLVEDLGSLAPSEPELIKTLTASLGDGAAVLCDALPGLRHIVSLPDGGSAPALSMVPDTTRGATEYVSRARLVAALIDLVGSLGTPGRAAVVALDDCHWADELTVEFLEAWASHISGDGSVGQHVLVLVAARSEGGPHRRLTQAPGMEILTLPALDATQIGQVVESMAGRVPADATKVVVELSRGNPLMVSAVLRGLVETKALSPAADGWQLKSAPGGWQASREAATFLARRFEVLEPATRRLLEAGAVLGRRFDLQRASLLAHQSHDETAQAIKQAVERHLVWAAEDGSVSFAHDRLRAGLLSELEQADLAELHRRAGEDIESADPSNIFDVAYHFDAAGAPTRALRYALRSAEMARARHDVELAERQYRIAERGMTGASRDTRYHVAEGLGQILALRGGYDEAAERFALAHSLADSSTKLAWINGQYGELLFKRDDLEGATAQFEAGLRALGEIIPSGGRIQLVLRLIWEMLHRLARRGFRRVIPVGTDPDQQAHRLTAYLYTRLLYPRWFHVRRLHTLCLMMRQINVSERCPEGVELAHAYSIWGGALALTFPFLWRRGLRYVDEGEVIYRHHGDQRGVGHMASMRALVLHAAGQYQAAIESADEAIAILADFGDRWEQGFAGRTRALCLYRLGHFRDAREAAQAVIDIGREVGDANAQMTALEVLVKAGGKVSAAQTEIGLSHQGNDIEVQVAALQAEALRLRTSGQLSEAIGHLERAVALVRRSQPTNTHLVPAFAWLATLHREHAEKPLLPHVRKRRIRRARAAARRAVRYARIYPNDRPHALRELGAVSALMGRRRRARRHLRRSATCAERTKAWAELLESNFQLKRLELDPFSGNADGEPGTVAERSDVPTLGLAARFAALLEAGVLLASTDSPDAIVGAIRTISQSLLRAETCRIVGLPKEWRLNASSITERESALVRRAAQQRRPVVLREPADGGGGWGAEHMRSGLCAPVFVHGTLACYFLVSHSQVDRLFGEEEQQLAEFVARLAGAALERQQHHRESRTRVIAAQEAERARVARDLHDEIGQALTSVLLGVRLVESSVRGRAPADDVEHLVLACTAELRDSTAVALDSVQRLAFDLRPAVLDDLGLAAAVRRLTASAITGDIDVALEAVNLEPGERLPTDIETTAYRVAQEGITNVVRHARASRCSVVIARTPRRLRVVVEDDGVGFVPTRSEDHGLGLLGMRERAALAGGRLTVDSEPGRGTSIVFEVPLDS